MAAARATDAPPTLREIATVADRIDPSDLRYVFTRSGGPGGQNVNKVNTRVTLLFDLESQSSFTEPERRRIRIQLGTRINRDGTLRVVSSRHRTQRDNRGAAFERLCGLIAVALRRRKRRKPTRVSAAAKRRRVDEKRRVGEKKRERRRPSSRPDP